MHAYAVSLPGAREEIQALKHLHQKLGELDQQAASHHRLFNIYKNALFFKCTNTFNSNCR